MSKSISLPRKVGLILGATRGIGRALTFQLTRSFGADGIVYASARRLEDGAVLESELAQQDLTIEPLLFDLANPSDPDRTAQEILKRQGGIDTVILNGAYMPRANVPAWQDARPMIAANNHGTLRVLRAFLPILRENGRIVVVASSLGVLSKLPEHLRTRFNAQMADPDAINRVMDDYVEAVEARIDGAQGWPQWVNIPSKVGQVAVTRAFAIQAKRTGALPAGALINIANPGVTKTDATKDFFGTVFKEEDAQTPDQAARSLLWLATLPVGTTSPYGELVEHGRVIPFGDDPSGSVN
jgi:NAD(P)-dependent dehydrogenase (short-subunit alcohol dehydrogenase family)